MDDIHANPTDRVSTGTRPSTGQREEFTLRIPKPGGGPVRAAIKTTEFWMTVALVVFLLLAAYVDEGFNRVDGWRFATWAVMAYVVSRGLAKLGNRSDATHDRTLSRH